jgi:hypothetical protein
MSTIPPQTFRHFLRPAVALVLVLSGCSSMSQDECRTVDWRTVGYEDGVNGYPGDRIAQHRKACAKYGVSTDLTLYQQGRDQGLREYCQPANGYRVGVQGSSYTGVCPASLEPGFVAAYNSGHQLFVLQSRVSNTDAQIAYRRRELNQIEHGIATNAVAVASNDSTAQDRANVLVDTEQLAERVGRLKAEIRQLEDARVNYERDLENYRAKQAPII